MALLLAFLFICGLFIEAIVSQGANINGGNQYNYELTLNASKAMTETAFSFNDEVQCLLLKYQNAKAKACKERTETNTPIATTNTLLSGQLTSDLQNLKDADNSLARDIAQCGSNSFCVYQRQLEGYYLIKSTEATSLTDIKSLKQNGLNQVKAFMDKCVQ